jgi:hypothetical protein
VKIIIGITDEPEEIHDFFTRYHGKAGTLTEFGPFISWLDASNWLVFLKSRIANVGEIIDGPHSNKQDIWYGFTFEQAKHN